MQDLRRTLELPFSYHLEAKLESSNLVICDFFMNFKYTEYT